MNKIRLSYSLISLWERGDIQGAIDTYFHSSKKGTQQMEDGRATHKEIAEYLEKFNCLPDYMNFSGHFTIPKVEHAVTVPYNEIIDLKGVFDCLEEPNLYEWKTGVSDSLEWARTWQLPLYFLICEIAKVDVKTAYLIRYNQYQKQSDMVVVHNSTKLRDKARNIVDSLGYEIWQYFSEQGLI